MTAPVPTPTPPPPDPDPVEEAGDPEPSEEISGEDLNIRMEGLKRDFPEYYDNIIRQIQRCFEYKGGGRLETAVIFYISRDGSVAGGNIDFYSRSGNFNFDFAAMGAVECAGNRTLSVERLEGTGYSLSSPVAEHSAASDAVSPSPNSPASPIRRGEDT